MTTNSIISKLLYTHHSDDEEEKAELLSESSTETRSIDSHDSGFASEARPSVAEEEEEIADTRTQCLFNTLADVQPLDYAKPMAKNNIVITSQEYNCKYGDSSEIRALQRDLMMAILLKDADLVTIVTEKLSQLGHARNFIACIASLWQGKTSDRVLDREYDGDFDKKVLNALLYVTNVPRAELEPSRMLTVAVQINDPLLLITAIDLGADVNDRSLRVSPLHNAIAMHHHELIEILKQHGARV